MGKIKGSFAKTYDRFVKRETLLPPGLLDLIKSLNAEEILEFACGTGTVAVGLALEGFDITGVDYSSDMLKAAKAKARQHRAKIKFILNDISQIRLDRKFDLILCLGNTIPQFTSQASLQRLLANCKRHLSDGGHIIFQQLNYDRILKERPQTFAVNLDNDVVRFKQYRYRKELIDFIVTVADGSQIPPRMVISKIVLKPWKSSELTDALKKTGFKKIQLFANYSGDKFDNKSNDMIVVAQI